MTEEQKNCVHEVDHGSLYVERDGDGAYIDLRCIKCGLSGCAGPMPPADEIEWEE